MQVTKLKECGFEESVLGFSLSYNTSIERAKELLPKYAFNNNGENKFLRAMQIWLDVTAPRFILTELDTYKIATVRLSESTIHTLSKKYVNQSNFEYPIREGTLKDVNDSISDYNNKKINIAELKNALPEGFLQRIIFNCNYANFQNMYNQRRSHRLPQWRTFLDTIVRSLDHPEFIIKEE